MGFGGHTFSEERDGDRLRGGLKRVLAFLEAHKGEEVTLEQVSLATDVPLSSVSSRIRDLKKEQFGNYWIKSRYISKGLWGYTFMGAKPIQTFKFEGNQGILIEA